MSKFDAQKVISSLQSKWGSRSCPMCGVGPWSIQDSTFQLIEYNEGAGLVLGGPIMPVIPVICMNCGNTLFVNAVVAGVVKPPVPPTGGESK